MNNLIETLIEQEHGASNTSARYSPVKTAKLLEALALKGYSVAQHSIASTRLEHKQGFQKHLLRLRHADLKEVNGVVPEIVVINSHDGGSATRVIAGVFRFVCANGLVVGNSFEEYRVCHVNNAVEKCLTAVNRVADYIPALTANIDRLQNTELNPDKIFGAALEVSKVLLKGKIATPYPATLLRTRRQADKGIDAFTILNVIQENALKGALEYQGWDKQGLTVLKKCRRIKSIDVKTAVNKAVWNAVERQAA